jgi:HAD superfamily hydrolase (TIGR01509 family)
MRQSQHRALDALIFDMGNVLIDWTPERLTRHFVKDEAWVLPLTEALFLSSSWKDLDQGLITEETVIQRVCALVPPPLHSLVQTIVTRWPQANLIDPRMAVLAKRLKANGIRLYLGSNASLKFHTYKADIEALTVFDGIQISADVQLSKPDPRFFEVLLTTHALNPRRTGFIDDLQRNCDSAASLGLLTHQYTRDFDGLVRWLVQVGALSDEPTVEENAFLE